MAASECSPPGVPAARRNKPARSAILPQRQLLWTPASESAGVQISVLLVLSRCALSWMSPHPARLPANAPRPDRQGGMMISIEVLELVESDAYAERPLGGETL